MVESTDLLEDISAPEIVALDGSTVADLPEGGLSVDALAAPVAIHAASTDLVLAGSVAAGDRDRG